MEGIKMSEDIKIKVNDADVDPLEELEGVTNRFGSGLGTNVGNLVKQVVRLQYGLVTLPLNILPANSRYHAKKAIHEAFLTVKTLVDDVNNGIEHTLTHSMDRDKVE
jgi:hypothetical protein